VAKTMKRASVATFGRDEFESLAWIVGSSIARILSNWHTCAEHLI
jgi:hypothetical protein